MTVEKGISAVVGPFSAENYTRAYEPDSWTAVRESGYTVGLSVWEEDHKKTETFDSTGRYYKKTNESESTNTEYTLDVSASLIIRADISIDLSDILNFITNLFK